MLTISAFYLDKQEIFVPNATKLCNLCDMMFDVSNYMYVVKPISVFLFTFIMIRRYRNRFALWFRYRFTYDPHIAGAISIIPFIFDTNKTIFIFTFKIVFIPRCP